MEMSFFKWLSNKLNPPRARIALGTQKNEYALGEEVRGDFQIVSEEEFEVEQIAVNLSCWENLKKTRTVSTQVGNTQKHRQQEYWDQAKLYSDQFVICNVARIPQGFSAKYPFTLKIPTVARETYYSVDNNVKWWMQATVRVRGRPSVETEKTRNPSRKTTNPSSASTDDFKRDHSGSSPDTMRILRRTHAPNFPLLSELRSKKKSLTKRINIPRTLSKPQTQHTARTSA